jgi:hypothetical protein
MSSHSPSVAQWPEGAIVKLAVHEQRDLDLPGQRFRTNFIQQQPTGVLPVGPLRAGARINPKPLGDLAYARPPRSR